MQILVEKFHQLLEQKKEIYQRQIFESFELDGRVMGIVGPRGIGKTTFLLEHTTKCRDLEKVLYVSADDVYFFENSLVDLARDFVNQRDGQLLVIDEIHRYKNWSQELKNIYDSYPNLKIIFSGSSSIDLVKSKYDLSRRAILYHLNGFSFREFLEYKLGEKFKIYSLDELASRGLQISKTLMSRPKLLGHFKEYLEVGYYPFASEFRKRKNFYQAILNIIDKSIYEDIASFYQLKTEHLIVFKKLLFFLATITPGEININKLAHSLAKDNKTILEYLRILNEIGLIRFLMNNKKGHSFVRNLEKIYIDNSVLLKAINTHLGKEVEVGLTREVFVCCQIDNAGYKIFYSQQGDISTHGYTFEIGGSGKKHKQIKDVKNAYLVKDNILVPGPREIPLYLFGFLY